MPYSSNSWHFSHPGPRGTSGRSGLPGPGGRHELGQNFLVDRSTIRLIADLVAATSGPIIEIGPGDGALTLPLSRTGRSLTVVEVDPRQARRLVARLPGQVEVVTGDVLRFRFPRQPHTIVGNLPFHLTTAVMRRVLSTEHWQSAVLLVQWEVARRRAGVGGASLLTAAWWPWFEFAVHARVPARAFRPMPSVDGGVLTMTRRATALVDGPRSPYQDFVRRMFTGPGRGLREILYRTGRFDAVTVREWLRDERLAPAALPKDLTAAQWASLWHLTGRRNPHRNAPRHRPPP